MVLVVGAVFGVGWWAAQSFVSPAQREAAASAPPPGPITAPVERGPLARTVSAKVTVQQSREDTSAMAIDAGVVTGAPMAAGALINIGDVVSEVSGRPLFAVQGDFRFYRDLQPGDEGPDVAQLQRALTAAGYPVPDSGEFAQLTERAVRELYEDADYEPAETPAAEPGTAATPAATPGPAAAAAKPTIVVPQAELIVLPVLPATLLAVPAVGSVQGGDPHISVRSGAPSASASIPNGVAAQLAVGLPATLTVDGSTLAVTISSVTSAAEGSDSIVVFDSADAAAPVPDGWLAREGLVSINLQKVADDALLVPSSAIANHGDTATVLVQQSDRGFLEVPVRELGALDGRSAVESVTPGTLAEGALVRVG